MGAMRTGGCACGAVRYKLEGEPFEFGLCHCADCRKESGSVFAAYAKWRIEDCEFAGDFTTYEGCSFCTVCGSRLFNLHPRDIEIRIGSLDEAPSTFGAPQRESWVNRREIWLAPSAGADQYSEDPPPL